MKQALLYLTILLFSSYQLQAQDFTFEYLGEARTTFQLSDQPGQDVVIKGLVTNQSSDTLNLTWIREEVYLSENWETAVCDKNRCYLTWVDTESFSLLPGESGPMDAHLYPRQQTGDSAIVNIKLLSSNNNGQLVSGSTSADTLDIPYYFYQETTSSVRNESTGDQLKIYPNPASTYFKVSSDQVIGSVEVFDILGKELIAVHPRSTETYVDVIGLYKGIYIVRIKDTNGKILKTQRLRKEMP